MLLNQSAALKNKRLYAWLAIVFMLLTLLTTPLVAYAASTSPEDIYRCTVSAGTTTVVSSPPAWTDILAVAGGTTGSQPSIDDEDAVARYNIAKSIISTFGKEATYKKAIADFDKYVEYDPILDVVQAKVKNANGENKFSLAISGFMKVMGTASTESQISGFMEADEFNPYAGGGAAFLNWFYGFINQVFFLTSNLMMWLFLGQTGFDAIYMMFAPVRPFIGPKGNSGGGGMGGYGGGYGGGNSASRISNFNIPICSDEVAAACNGGSQGMNSTYSGGGSGQGTKSIPAITYVIARSQYIIILAVYLTLVRAGWWPKIIAWVAGYATQALSFVVR